jgi:uncharacterized membrane protein
MEWDGGTIWRVALGVLFVLCGVGVAYALFRLGSVLRRITGILTDVNSHVLPLLTRVEATLDGVNSELVKVDQITGSVAEIVKAAEQTTTALHAAVATPIRKVVSLVTGVRETAKSFVAARRKGY